jgi:hypothetical protein
MRSLFIFDEFRLKPYGAKPAALIGSRAHLGDFPRDAFREGFREGFGEGFKDDFRDSPKARPGNPRKDPS